MYSGGNMFGMKKDKKSGVPGEPDPLIMPNPLDNFPDPFAFPDSSSREARIHHERKMKQRAHQQNLMDAMNMNGVQTGRFSTPPKPVKPEHLRKQLQIDDTWSIRKKHEPNQDQVTVIGTSDTGEEIILDSLHMALYRELKASRLALQQVEEGLSNVRTRRKETQISLLLQNEEIGDNVL